MDARLFDMLHDACDVDVGAVAEGIDVNLGRAGEVAVEEDGAVTRDMHGLADVAVELVHVADDFHRAAAEDVGRADDEGEADAGRDLDCLFGGGGDAVDGLFEAELFDELLEPFAVFGKVDGVGRGAEDGMPASWSALASLRGVWPPNWTMTPWSVPLSRSTRRISMTCSKVSGSK